MPAPAPASLPAITDQQDADRQFCRDMARELAELSMEVARIAGAEARQAPTPAALAAFERVARGARRALLLLRTFTEPPRAPTRPEARREVAREVARRIAAESGSDPGPERAETLRAELHERLDHPGFDSDLLRHPVSDIVRQICQDLGLGADSPAPARRYTPAEAARTPDAELRRACQAEQAWFGPAKDDDAALPLPGRLYPKLE